MNLTPDQFDELITTIGKLAPSPLIPLLTSVGGVVVGFLLSFFSTAWIRRSDRVRGLAASIEQKRQSAVDELGRNALWWAQAFQVGKSDDGRISDRVVAERFLTTGDPGDQVVWKTVLKYFDALRENLYAYSTNAHGVVRYDAYTDEEQATYEERIERVRAQGQRWVNDGARPKVFAVVLDDEIRALEKIRRERIVD
jgi:hypothetical protein